MHLNKLMYTKFLDLITTHMSSYRRFILVIIDIFIVIFTIKFLGLTTIDFNFNDNTEKITNEIYLASSLIVFLVYFISGQYKALTRYVGSNSFYTLSLRTAAICLTIFLLGIVINIQIIPKKFFLLFWIIITLFSGLIRLFLRDFILRSKLGVIKKVQNAVIYGASDSGAALLNYISSIGKYRVISFIDEDPSLWGRTLRGIKINSPKYLIKNNPKVDTLLLSIKEINKESVRKIIKALNSKILIQKFTPLDKVSYEHQKKDAIKPILIEDLLKREVVKVDDNFLKKSVKNKIILVTGAGGSIGKEIAKQISLYNPKKLILLEKNELSIYSLEKIMANIKISPNYIDYILGDCLDNNLLEKIFSENKIDIIFHSAAYKHVPIVEKNPIAGLRNNIISTYNLCNLAKLFKFPVNFISGCVPSLSLIINVFKFLL